LFGHTYQVLCMQYDRTHHRLITGSDDWTIKIWCARTGWLLHTLRGHVGEVQILALNRESTMIASGATDGTIRIWCLRTGKPV
ncbi:WD40-repeat-containing domain protein, partial [Blastocladiella britannica]